MIRERLLASARIGSCLGRHAWPALMSHLVLEGSWVLLCFMFSPWPQKSDLDILAMRFWAMLITAILSQLMMFYLLLSLWWWDLTHGIFTNTHNWASRGSVTCTVGLAFSGHLIFQSWNYLHFLISQTPPGKSSYPQLPSPLRFPGPQNSLDTPFDPQFLSWENISNVRCLTWIRNKYHWVFLHLNTWAYCNNPHSYIFSRLFSFSWILIAFVILLKRFIQLTHCKLLNSNSN